MVRYTKHMKPSRKNKKVVIVLPAYNAEKTLKKTIRDIPEKYKKNIILVDDFSSDRTVAIATKLKLNIFLHDSNRGYGANQKTCYMQALKQKADVIVMLHPDYQYDPTKIPELIAPILNNTKDIMLGSRITSLATSKNGGMPTYKYVGNRFLTTLANNVLGQNLSEYHTGYRAYSKYVLRTIPFKSFSDNFVFDQQILIYALKNKCRIGEISVPVRYFPEASSISFVRSVRYGIETIWNLFFMRV